MSPTSLPSVSQISLSYPSIGRSPAGFERIHAELLPREVGRIIGYDPRTLVMKPKRTGVARGTRDLTPHNVSPEIVSLQNQVQRSIDTARVAIMVDYLKSAMETGSFADWGPIELVTTSIPDMAGYHAEHIIRMDADADYFIADGQHRYCAILDFCRENPTYCDRFTQAVTISVLPSGKLVEWAGQAFHDRNYFAAPVRAGKALAVDSRDPLNALAKRTAELPTIHAAGGIAYERDTLLKGDTRFTTHTVLHRFIKGFLYGRTGLERTSEQYDVPSADEVFNLNSWISTLGEVLPWVLSTQTKEAAEERDAYITRTSVVLSALAVIGHDLYYGGYRGADLGARLDVLKQIDWRKSNARWVGIVGSLNKDGALVPASSRPAIDSTIRFLREVMRLTN